MSLRQNVLATAPRNGKTLISGRDIVEAECTGLFRVYTQREDAEDRVFDADPVFALEEGRYIAVRPDGQRWSIDTATASIRSISDDDIRGSDVLYQLAPAGERVAIVLENE